MQKNVIHFDEDGQSQDVSGVYGFVICHSIPCHSDIHCDVVLITMTYIFRVLSTDSRLVTILSSQDSEPIQLEFKVKVRSAELLEKFVDLRFDSDAI